MYKIVGMFLALMFTLPVFAHAWTISARVASGSGNVYNGGTPVLPTPGYVSVANTISSLDLTITPAVGSSISSVLVDGKAATPVSQGVYRVNYNSTSSHSVTAYFADAKYTVTSTQDANGTFTVQQTAPTTTIPSTGILTNLPTGSKIKVIATPKDGYRVSKITVGGVDYSPAGPLSAGTAFSASDITINTNTTVTASYGLVPMVSINSLATTPVPIINNKSVSLTISASGNATAGALSYSVAIKDSNGNPARIYADGKLGTSSMLVVPAVTGNSATFGYYQAMHYSYYLAPGNYSAFATATGANGGNDTMFVDFSVIDAETYATNSCTGCHSNSTPTIVTNWQAGKHAAPRTQEYQNICFRCHTAEGYLYAEKNAYTGDVGTLLAFQVVTSLPATASPIGCATCHTTAPHNGGLRSVVGWTSAETGAAAEQFNVCTSCHTLSVKGPDGNQQAAQHYHAAGYVKLGRVISDTHFDNPATPAGQGTENGTTIINKIEGYVVRVNSATPCSDCHDMHRADIQPPGLLPDPSTPPSIHQQWARSGHAAKILKVKEDYVKANFSSPNGNPGSNTTGELDSAPERTAANAALVSAQAATDTTAAAWTHYTWNDSTGTSNDRKSCQHCHTATGAANYLNNQASYDPANNNFSHLNGWSANKNSPQAEVLYCWGCHSNAGTGQLRATDATTLDYKASSADTANIVIPKTGNGKSAACISCHAGRGNIVSQMGAGFTVATPDMALSSTTTPKNSASATATHYLNAGATIFKDQTKVGYEFPGLNYTNPGYYEHNAIGCTDCHMSSSQSHSFKVVAQNASGAVTGLMATNCVTCHNGDYGTKLQAGDAAAASFLDKEASGYAQALAAFNDALIAQGYTWSSSYPYFLFTGTQSDLKWRTQGDLGCGHNFNYLKHEPGAYAHNSLYAKRLIFDSIDWLDNGALGGTIQINAASYPQAAVWFGAAAGTTGSYTVARP